MLPFSDCETGSILATVASALDVTLTRTRTLTKTQDSYGHTTPATTSNLQVQVNLVKPNATQLQAFAGIIGSQRAMMLRALQTTDIREGDTVVYDGLSWTVHEVMNAESYTWTKEYLIATVV